MFDSDHPSEMEITATCRIISVDVREIYWLRVYKNHTVEKPNDLEGRKAILKKLEPWNTATANSIVSKTQ